jgi:hypothetical protein
MIFENKIQGHRVAIYNNGDLYVDGSYTGLRRWQSSSTNWSNSSGQEIKDLRGKSLEDVLRYKGYIR